MVVLQKSVQADIEHIPSFQETYKLAYSHGLETIYSLENVDIRSVRKLVIPSEKKSQDAPKTIIPEWTEAQLTFDLGSYFRGWMVPYISQEPIQVLQLSKQVEKILIEKKIHTLGVLKEVNFFDTFFLKGLGQGNIEEVRKKLEAYFEGKSVQRTTTIDFLSLLKCLCAHLDRKKTFALLELYGLTEWLSLTPAEGVELKKLKPDVRHLWSQEIRETITGDKFLNQALQLLIDTWIIPWIWRRGGFATQEQIYEVLHLRSSSQEMAEKIIPLLFDWMPLTAFLRHENGVYAASEAEITLYKELIQVAATYFVHPETSYSLAELENLIRIEYARSWRVPAPFHALRLSSLFHFYKKGKGEWHISYN